MRRSACSPQGGSPRRKAVCRVVVTVGSRRHAAGRNHAPDPAQPAIYARVMEHIVPESQRPLFDAWHFAPAVVHDGIAFLSGVTGMGPDGRCAADAEEQFTQLFESITLVLTEASLTWSDVIEMTSWHTDMAELPIFQQVRDRYVVEPWPAWTAVGTTGLALPDARAEVRIVARRP
ncbi:MAG TPA: RidA family protein [Acidimicrobiaceae bacterium]|nr:RidA family protein [Acidimicrobiaceae bacterium]